MLNALTLCEPFAFHEELPLSHIQPVSAAGCGDLMKMILLPAQRVLDTGWCSNELSQHIRGLPGCASHSSALFHFTDTATTQYHSDYTNHFKVKCLLEMKKVLLNKSGGHFFVSLTPGPVMLRCHCPRELALEYSLVMEMK